MALLSFDEGRLISDFDVGSSLKVYVDGSVPAGVSAAKCVCLSTAFYYQQESFRRLFAFFLEWCCSSRNRLHNTVMHASDAVGFFLPSYTRNSKRNTESCSQPERLCKPRKNQHKPHVTFLVLFIPSEIIGGVNRKAKIRYIDEIAQT